MTTFTIDQLFTPSPSGIGPSIATPPAGSWMAQNLANATTVGLVTTAWQAGSPTRSWLAVSAIDQAKQDTLVSGLAQAGFLDWAASGTVTYTTPTGVSVTTPVSPDPSDPSSGNVNGAPTWMDMLAQSGFGVTREPAYPATPTMTFANTSAVIPAEYLPGTYHVQNTAHPTATYHNDLALTIAPSSVLGGSITAISSSGAIQITTSGAHGLSTGASVYLAGAPLSSLANGFWQVAVTGTSTFTLNGSISGTGGSGGAVYSTTQADFTADAVGTSYSASAGDISETVTSNVGVECWNFGPCTGVNYESNASLAARCRLSFAALSPNGAPGAYVYFAKGAYGTLLSEGITLDYGPVVQALEITNPQTGSVTTVVAQSGSASTVQGAQCVFGSMNLTVTGATNASPIKITYTGGSVSDGETVIMSGVLGNSAANGTFTASYVDSTSFYLVGSTGTGTYTGGGQIAAGDLGLIDSVIQGSCVPDGDTAYTVSALVQQVTFSATVTVPQAQITAYTANVLAMLQAFVTNLPIGGLPLATGGSGIPVDLFIGILYAAGSGSGQASYVTKIVAPKVNGSLSGLVFDPALNGLGRAVMYPAPTITVVGA